MYVPDVVIDNRYWEQRLDTNDAWIVAKTGIHQRRYLKPGQNLSDMCAIAAREALDRAGMSSEQVDAIVLNTFTPDYYLPSTALIVKEILGATNAVPIDLCQVACAGVVYGTFVGAHLLQNRAVKTVLVIGGDAMSRIVNPADRGSCVFFGDGAGALVLRRTADHDLGFLGWSLGSALSMDVAIPHGGSADPITHESLDRGKHRFAMNGRTVWREAIRLMPDSIRLSAAQAGLTVEDIDFFLLHQANYNIIQEVLRDLDVPESRTYCNVARYGNTSGGTLPTVYHGAVESGLLGHGDVVAFAGVGAGFMWGSMLLRHSEDLRDYE
ncbi:MAG: beta-ketoacyl-ACP synthase 3 [Micromonosporaceae bacterium]|nr:beta-ketoacyl-ACP synthase 3 [Micromonosporaceae bacterium]